MASQLQKKHDTMAGLYQAHRDSVLDLQEALRVSGFTKLVEELDLDDRSSRWVQDWIHDKGSVFRMLKKHQFNIAHAYAALQQTLRWRIAVLAPLLADADASSSVASFIQCLPHDARDLFGRPVLLIRLAELPADSGTTKDAILTAYEATSLRLRPFRGGDPILQCVVMIDFRGATMRSMAVELFPWFVHEVAPRYPGMCAAVLMVNYSWAYSGMYSVVKRLLPSNVLARILFPSRSELLLCFNKASLPRDYGGDLDLSSEYRPPPAHSTALSAPSPSLQYQIAPLPNTGLSHYLPSMSLLNPYFGYPAVSDPSSSTPYLKNGRRRKRDLARTLGLLWLAKLKRTADKTWLWIIISLVLWAFELRG